MRCTAPSRGLTGQRDCATQQANATISAGQQGRPVTSKSESLQRLTRIAGLPGCVRDCAEMQSRTKSRSGA
jgi:hypothetical protein